MLTLVTAKTTVDAAGSEKRELTRYAFIGQTPPSVRLTMGANRTEDHPIIDFSRAGMALGGSSECEVGDTGYVKLVTRTGKRNRYAQVGGFTVRRTWSDADGGLAIEVDGPAATWIGMLPEA